MKHVKCNYHIFEQLALPQQNETLEKKIVINLIKDLKQTTNNKKI